MTQSFLVAARQPTLGSCLSASIRELGRSVAGPFRRNAEALNWLDAEAVDGTILDILLEDGSAFQLAAALYRDGIPVVFFAGFDPHRQIIRAEFPNRPGPCQGCALYSVIPWPLSKSGLS
jgi:DNA-binding NarL/FixJ family response regulator